MEGQLEYDLQHMPFDAPSVEPKQKQKKKEPAEKAPSAAQIKKAKQLADVEKAKNEATEKGATIRKIEKYIAQFPDRVNVKLPRGFGMKMSLEELQVILTDVELDLNSTGGTEYLASLYVGALGFAQDLNAYYNPMGLALSGPTADIKGSLVAQQGQWLKILQELAVKYERTFAMGPERRLLAYTATLFFMVDRANKAGGAMQDAGERPIGEDLAQEAADILKK